MWTLNFKKSFIFFQMLRKSPKLDQPVPQINVGILPREILCIIFTYLEEKSMRSASETCKLWLELIRNDSNFSSHIVLKYNGLKELKLKIERSEWIWDRWPVLKVLKLGPTSVHIDEPVSADEALDLVKSINFKECPTLEKVIISVNFPLDDFFTEFHLGFKIATVEQLTFNPKHANESFGREQISVLHIDLDASNPFMDLSMFDLNIFEYLNDSIQTVKLTVKYIKTILYLSNTLDFVTDLYVKQLTGSLLKSTVPIFQQFKRMRKCQVNVTLWSVEEWLYFEKQGPIIVNEKFQDMTEVKFVFKNCFAPISTNGSEKIFEAIKVTKKPFEKSVTKPIKIHTYS